MAAAHVESIKPVDKLDAFLLTKGHQQFRCWKNMLLNWAQKNNSGAVWGTLHGVPTRVYRVGKTLIVARTLHQSS